MAARAVLQYDGSGRLTNVTDTAGLSSSFLYDSQNWITNLTTPYGTTTFEHVDNGSTNSNEPSSAPPVVDPAGGTNIYMLRQYFRIRLPRSVPVPTEHARRRLRQRLPAVPRELSLGAAPGRRPARAT